ncbi:TRAP transporter permease [Halalkalibacterium ligniniphilum]|uniref:TRAP transporter permease n=1 Tax=Halalkalibacterium ligniniphilum TaxID=1134413 RepID=UPI00034B2385|nr:TRAP transporter permease [Halalkalibacterium ligniniphilum]
MQRSTLLLWISTIIGIYHIIIAGQFLPRFGFFIPTQIQLAISLSCALLIIFILFRASKKNNNDRIPFYDYLLIGMVLVSLGYVIFFYEKILQYSQFGFLDTTGIILALFISIPLLEAVRRKTGWVFPILILTLVSITIFQKYLPGILYGQGYSIDRLLYSAYVGSSGIFGLPLNVAASILIIFLIFGALLERAGAGKWFMDIALALTGWSKGGPAKASVVSSALFGSISGSPSGNVATTGIITIPLMKKIGYTPKFAAAVEATSSTGGQFLPPVMGAIAFVMAEWIGVPYSQIAIAALIPALLYFLIVFVSVHLQAYKEGIPSLPKKQLPNFWKSFTEGWFYLVPIIALIYFLIIQEYSPAMSGIYSLPFLIGCSFLAKDRKYWLLPKNIMLSFQTAVKSWVLVAAITAAVGIMVGALELSGVGIKFSQFIIDVSGGNLILTLVLVGLGSLILGMGLDSIPAYITLATLIAPALIQLGIPDLSAHLFIIYWGLASFITPPVCIAVFVACGLSGSKVWETGGEAIRLGIAAYLIPFAFIFSPGLLLQGTVTEITLATITAVTGAVLLACSIRGYALKSMNILERIFIGIAGVLLIGPSTLFAVIGFGIGVTVLLWQWFNKVKYSSEQLNSDLPS